jgi:hypothetical protein
MPSGTTHGENKRGRRQPHPIGKHEKETPGCSAQNECFTRWRACGYEVASRDPDEENKRDYSESAMFGNQT